MSKRAPYSTNALTALIRGAGRPVGEERTVSIRECRDGRFRVYDLADSPVAEAGGTVGFDSWLSAMAAMPRAGRVTIKASGVYGFAPFTADA